jgi:hypothetical protein
LKAEDLFEQWGLDLDALVRTIVSRTGDLPMVLGGSLVDGLGTVMSDVDVFCFGSPRAPDLPVDRLSPLMQVATCWVDRVEVNLHFVEPSQLSQHGDEMRQLVQPEGAARLPAIGFEELFVLHALARGPALTRGDEVDRVRDLAAADLFSTYLCLRSVSVCRAFRHDVESLVEGGETNAALAAARHSAESAVDALLAVRGYANPNPKWRVTLVEQAIIHGRLGIRASSVLAALFPRWDRAHPSLRHSVELARTCLEQVAADPLMRTYPICRAALQGMAPESLRRPVDERDEVGSREGGPRDGATTSRPS